MFVPVLYEQMQILQGTSVHCSENSSCIFQHATAKLTSIKLDRFFFKPNLHQWQDLQSWLFSFISAQRVISKCRNAVDDHCYKHNFSQQFLKEIFGICHSQRNICTDRHVCLQRKKRFLMKQLLLFLFHTVSNYTAEAYFSISFP